MLILEIMGAFRVEREDKAGSVLWLTNCYPTSLHCVSDSQSESPLIRHIEFQNTKTQMLKAGSLKQQAHCPITLSPSPTSF